MKFIKIMFGILLIIVLLRLMPIWDAVINAWGTIAGIVGMDTAGITTVLFSLSGLIILAVIFYAGYKVMNWSKRR